MGKSIVESDWGEFPFDQPQCFICGAETGLEKHHIFAGHANRRISEREGFWVTLCSTCHRDPKTGAQYNTELSEYLKAQAQMAYEETHTREEWMKLMRKNYLPLKKGNRYA